MEQAHAHHDAKYFIMGNNKILISEHFRENGKEINQILMQIILDAEKKPESRINTAK